MHDTKRRKRNRATSEQGGAEKVSHRAANDRVKTMLTCFWQNDVPVILQRQKNLCDPTPCPELESFLRTTAQDLCVLFPEFTKNAQECAQLLQSKIEEASLASVT